MSWKLNSSDFISDWVALGVSKQKSIERLAATACQDIRWTDSQCIQRPNAAFWVSDQVRRSWFPTFHSAGAPQWGPSIASSLQRVEHHLTRPRQWLATTVPRHGSHHGIFRQRLIRSTAYPMSFISQDFIAGATVSARAVSTFSAAERLGCKHTRELVPPRLQGTWCRASTLVNIWFLSRLIRLFLQQSKGGLAPHGWNRAVQSVIKRNS